MSVHSARESHDTQTTECTAVLKTLRSGRSSRKTGEGDGARQKQGDGRGDLQLWREAD